MSGPTAGRATGQTIDRGIVSDADLRRPGVRRGVRAVHAALLVALVVVGLGPILWLAKAAVTPTQDTLRAPIEVFPNGIDWANLAEAWTRFDIDLHFFNTLWLALGSWAVQLLVAVTGGYVLSVLRPAYARVLGALVLSTLFVPAVVLLVPLYLTVLDVPVANVSLINTFWAVWLPAGANAFNVLLVARFFDGLPREVFEAAKVDGAGPFRLGWSIVLPMSRPIIGVVSVFAFITAWKDFLWPLLVLRDPAVQPLSVRLPALQDYVELDVLLAALAISTVIPIAIFLVFQRLFLSGAGLSGAVKG
ncbi:carbohydrate ABC transporter permease [Myceligenerans pegani]|uniref:Carbohydrate ABC transporter permease n=1 Tax=Myceligenerans pegani TaxID=2776917 RepID=A0ABR9MVC9_9MICO|nr:carbohydrate ABC transporter permease [Myceligenerans sp. TRM 65318]MBE1875345.1 carbohydrate ABC transporter permease [Myceligenerans sp. TRM 65318]MBE3017616.1 carbohydrate ABC transporter permease [Myceligenerans sp. TRM 65318]